MDERGGLATAQYLLDKEEVSCGYVRLWEMKRLDLTVEAVVIQEPWTSLFTDNQLATARWRLTEYGYNL